MHCAKQLVIQKNDMWPSKRQDPSASGHDFVKFFCEDSTISCPAPLFNKTIGYPWHSEWSLFDIIIMNCLPVKFFDQTIGYPVRVSDMWHSEAWYGGPTPHICLSSSNERKNLQICLFFYIFFKNKNNMWHLEAWSAQSHTSVSLHPMKEKMSDCFFLHFCSFFFK